MIFLLFFVSVVLTLPVFEEEALDSIRAELNYIVWNIPNRCSWDGVLCDTMNNNVIAMYPVFF